MKIRNLEQTDIPVLQTVAEETGLFPPEMLPGMAAPFLSDPDGPHHLLTALDGADPIGMAYAAPEDLTDGTWNLLALAVRPAEQGRGHGRALVLAMEQTVKARGARLLIIDTSGSAEFERMRAFYDQLGYAREARIRDFWAEGDDKIIFAKKLI